MLVVMRHVLAQDRAEVTMAEDQQPVEAFAAGAADPTLGVRPRLRRAHRRFDHPDTFGAEDLVELAREFAVAIADEEPRSEAVSVVELHQQVARLVGHPPPVRVRGDSCQADAPGSELDEEEHVEAPEEQGVDGEEIALEDARRLLAQKLRPGLLQPSRCGLDPRPPASGSPRRCWARA